MSQQQEKGLDLEQLLEKVGRLVRMERTRVAGLGRLATVLRVLAFLFGLATAAAILYGALTFPDAPIRVTEAGFVGKTGAVYSQEHYQHFKIWERTLLIGFALAVLSGIGIVAEARLAGSGDDSG